eukprot:scaffold10067_cov67-Phaeocystis_antarctica.AAC.4
MEGVGSLVFAFRVVCSPPAATLAIREPDAPVGTNREPRRGTLHKERRADGKCGAADVRHAGRREVCRARRHGAALQGLKEGR